MIFILTYITMVISIPPSDWQGIEHFAASFETIQFAPPAIGLLLLPSYLVMLGGVHWIINRDKAIWSLVGLLFAVICVTLATMAYFVQLAVVLLKLTKGELDGLAMLVLANDRSLMWAVNYLGWTFVGLSIYFVAFMFVKGVLEKWIR